MRGRPKRRTVIGRRKGLVIEIRPSCTLCGSKFRKMRSRGGVWLVGLCDLCGFVTLRSCVWCSWPIAEIRQQVRCDGVVIRTKVAFRDAFIGPEDLALVGEADARSRRLCAGFT